jgi:hypothetical protein
MIPYLTLGVTLLSLVATLFLMWFLAAPREEEETRVVGFHYEPPQEDENDAN